MESNYHSQTAFDRRAVQRMDEWKSPFPFRHFYHVACIGNWKEVFHEQVGHYSDVGLQPFAYVLGSQSDADYVRQHVIVIGTSEVLEEYETPTLEALYQFCKEQPNGAVLYTHTKGVSAPDDETKDWWRRLMDRIVSMNWRQNLDLLRLCDMVGHNWMHNQYPHFCGNFWMARSDWIANLPNPREYREMGGPNWFSHPWCRMHAEMWLGCKPWHNMLDLLGGQHRLWEPGVSCTLYERFYGQYVPPRTKIGSQVFPITPEFPVLDYHSQAAYELRMSARKSAARPLSPLVTFYHVACIGNWKEVVEEQCATFNSLGLTPRSYVLGSLDDVAWLQTKGIEVLGSENDFSRFETPTLHHLWEWCRSHDGAVLYCHTKGVSSPSCQNKIAWRKLMTHYVIEKVQDNLNELRCYDIVGMNWQEMPNYPHYSGNFWMARADWIRMLEPPWEHRNKGGPMLGSNPWERMHAEMWLGSKPWHHMRSLCCINETFWEGPRVFEFSTE